MIGWGPEKVRDVVTFKSPMVGPVPQHQPEGDRGSHGSSNRPYPYPVEVENFRGFRRGWMHVGSTFGGGAGERSEQSPI